MVSDDLGDDEAEELLGELRVETGVVGYAVRLGRGVVTVVPVTSNVNRVLPFQVLLRAGSVGLKVDSKAQAEQVRSVSVERLDVTLGRVPAPVMDQVDEALRLHLGL